jgi:uncharacterized membrane protein YdjX (TVP38/TMEM64 family)
MLSNDAKLKDIRAKITEVAKNERTCLLIIPMGVFLVGVGLIFSIIGGTELAYFGGLVISSIGIFSTFFGFYMTVHYVRLYNDLLKELAHHALAMISSANND